MFTISNFTRYDSPPKTIFTTPSLHNEALGYVRQRYYRLFAAPAGVLNDTQGWRTGISVNGILKLLQNLKPGKAAGPDQLKPLLLKELREENAPLIQVIFEQSIKQVNLS